MQATWWEKTVEYDFVIRLASNDRLDFAAPIAGRHERSSGDGIFGKDNKLVLVEFKKDYSEIESEKTIFNDYEAATAALNSYDHHWIVYGALTENGELDLWNQKYFEPEEYFLDITDILTTGVTHTTFMEYLTKLQSFRIPDARGSGGRGQSSHVSAESMLTVMGVSSSGKLIGSMSLEQYRQELKPSPPAPRIDLTPTPSPPRFGF
ncbi:hypothetical protein [Pseudomonas monteilii]|uniref:hypothetical protein n=1 Tax=Pseudomonas monteilii TaxID=76759 RepID=UPI00048EE6B5|nr:hypothetical protein [Pseudomonas monteilii]MDH0021314.1 hypothetical protein [Pseudomonas monteilii]